MKFNKRIIMCVALLAACFNTDSAQAACSHTYTWVQNGPLHEYACSKCNHISNSHNENWGSYSAVDDISCIRTCSGGCGFTKTENHSFTSFIKKASDATNYTELYQHVKKCEKCGKEENEVHVDDGTGVCIKCGQTLWKVISQNNKNGDDITESIKTIENSKSRNAINNEIVKIVTNTGGTAGYVQNIYGAKEFTAGSDNTFSVNQNGTYRFGLVGSQVNFNICNISSKVDIVQTIIPTILNTDKATIILAPASSESDFNKKVYVKDSSSSEKEITVSSPFTKEVTSSGTYTFTASDTAGNTDTVNVEVNLLGQALVAKSDNVFANGYIFTEILVKPTTTWSATVDKIKASVKVYKSDGTEITVSNDNLKIVKVLKENRETLEDTELSDGLSAGQYYIQLAIGGSIFGTPGSYVVELENATINNGSDIKLAGKNRIVVDVNDFINLT